MACASSWPAVIIPINAVNDDHLNAINEYNCQPAWKAHLGQGVSWDITMDAGGKQILDEKQLFQT